MFVALASKSLAMSARDTPPVRIIVVLLGLVLVGAFTFGLIWLLRRRHRAPRAAAEPTCGKCGYIVKGLTTFTCPECGSDLREVGIVATPRRQ